MKRPDLQRSQTFPLGRAGAIMLLLLPTACGNNLVPFETTPLAAPPGVTDAGPRIGICYNSWSTTPQAVRKAAQDACGADAHPQLAGQDMHLSCALATPVRATFVCAPD